MSVVILQNEIVHYEVLGRGKPLIFLHGWVGSWRYWLPSMQAASTSYRTYALDLWGFGDTAKVSDRYTLDQQVRLIDLFLQELGIRKIAMIGHGLGGVIAMLYASMHKTTVDRVMAISLPTSEHPLISRFYSSSPRELASWLINRSSENGTAQAEATKTDQNAIQYSLLSMQEFNMQQLAKELDSPCLCVYGQNDPAMERVHFKLGERCEKIGHQRQKVDYEEKSRTAKSRVYGRSGKAI
jgi:3-oxoadipate enol-lactonase